MRIIDKQKDYYDYIEQFGIDPKVTYNRSIYYDTKDLSPILDTIEMPYYKDVHWVSLYIGGWVYRVACHFKDGKYIRIDDMTPYLKNTNGWKYLKFNKVDNFMQSFGVQCEQPTLKRVTLEYKSPIMLSIQSVNDFGRTVWDAYVNPNLQRMGLAWIVDAETVWQKVNMWLSTNESLPIPDIKETEKQFVDRHGFEKDYAFRKRKN